MSKYLITEILLILFIGLWGMAKHHLSEEESENKRLKNQNEELKKSHSIAYEEIGELKDQRKRDLRCAIYHSVISSQTKYDPEELTQTIIEHLRYVGEIENVEDLFKYDFEYIVKVTQYAKDGLLDVYYNYEIYGEKPFLIAADGQHVFITEQEVKEISNRDYSSIFKSKDREAKI